MRITGVSFGDTHAGQRNALIRPGTVLSWGVGSEAEERTYNDDVLSDWSLWLWYEVWLPAIAAFVEFANGDPVILAHSGDAVHGDRFAGRGGEKYFYSIHANHQEQIAKEILRPFHETGLPIRFYLAYGTGSHDYSANSSAENIALSVNPWGWNAVADDHIEQNLPGHFLFNLAHHGPSVSKIARLRAGGPERYVLERIQDALAWDDRHPDLYQRGHVHMPVSTPVVYKHGPREIKSHIIVTPPLCGPNGYARQATRSMERVECGLYFWEVVDGKLGAVVPFLKAKSTRKTYAMPQDGNLFFSHMITEGGHKTGKKKRKQRKKK